MDSPFLGMGAYLEQHWRSVHQRMITYAGDQLQAALPLPPENAAWATELLRPKVLPAELF